MSRRRTRTPVTISLAALFAVSACGQARSVEALCDTVTSEKQRISERLESAAGDPNDSSDDLLAMFAVAGTSMAELGTYLKTLEKVAPSEIQPEFEELVRIYDRQVDNASASGAESLISAVTSGFQAAGPIERAGGYVQEHCGQSL